MNVTVDRSLRQTTALTGGRLFLGRSSGVDLEGRKLRKGAAEAGLDECVAEATPEKKLELIRENHREGRVVAMCGDGKNDALALAEADVALAMKTGAHAAHEAANMIDLDSNPTKLIEVVGVGKQMLAARGAFTTFSIASGLASPESAILSTVMYNALVIVPLIWIKLIDVLLTACGWV